MTFLEAAKAVLEAAGEPLRADEIARRAIEQNLIDSAGATPDATMRAQLGSLVRRPGGDAVIVKVSRGLWGVRECGSGSEQADTAGGSPAAVAGRQRRHWFFATNPRVYDAEELFRRDTETWGDVIQGHLAQKRLREDVRTGDTAFVYRTRPHQDVFCEVEVITDPLPNDSGHTVQVRPIRKLEPPIPLQAMRECPALGQLAFLRNPRHSITGLSQTEYETISELVGQEATPAEDYTHDAVQWMLIRLGKAFGCGVWVASDCRNRTHDGEAFADHCLPELPNLGFSRETTDLVRGIDVLWLRGNSVLAAFEIEHTTSIYSGLLRMSDLLSLQPNINIDLYIVAPAARRAQVAKQLNRPTFDRLPRPLNQVCKLISYDGLERLVTKVEGLAGFLQVDLIKTIAEGCA